MLPQLTNDEDFKREFSDEKKCLEYLEKLKYKDEKRICPKCKKGKLWKLKKREHIYECAKCHHQESVLSGTLFQDTHKPLELWFKAIWDIATYIIDCNYKDNKINNEKTGHQLQETLNIKTYKTAWTWIHKLRRIMVHPDNDRLSGKIEIIKTYVEVPKKGNKGNDNKAMIAIAMEMLDENIERIRIGILPDIPQVSFSNFIQETVKEKSKIEIYNNSGEKDCEIKTNEYEVSYVYQKQDIVERHRDIISKIKNWINEIKPGSVLKHLPYYLDEYTFRYNHRGDLIKDKLFRHLIQNAFQSEPVTYQNIIAKH